MRFSKIFELEFWKRMRGGFSAIASIVSFVFGIIGTSVAIVIPLLDPSLQGSVAVWTICAMFLLFVVWSIYREYHLARKQKYANISARLQGISSRIQELGLFLLKTREQNSVGNHGTDPISVFSERVESILDDVVSIFSMLTGTHCRATIKVVKDDKDKVWVHTLARDRHSAFLNMQSDADRYETQHDAIEGNEDFDLLFDKKKDDQGYYFNNNLPGKPYRSTSVSYKQKQEVSHEYSPERKEPWLLDYKSAIVFPIRQLQKNPGEESVFYGFLAVDSESQGVFDKRWDTAIGASVAHQLFIPLCLFLEISNKINNGKVPVREDAV